MNSRELFLSIYFELPLLDIFITIFQLEDQEMFLVFIFLPCWIRIFTLFPFRLLFP